MRATDPLPWVGFVLAKSWVRLNATPQEADSTESRGTPHGFGGTASMERDTDGNLGNWMRRKNAGPLSGQRAQLDVTISPLGDGRRWSQMQGCATLCKHDHALTA